MENYNLHSNPINFHYATGKVDHLQRRRGKKKTILACLPCQRSHYPCDEGRPCQSCVKRGRAEECVDGMKKRAKYLDEPEQGESLLLLAGSGTSASAATAAEAALGATGEWNARGIDGRSFDSGTDRRYGLLAAHSPSHGGSIKEDGGATPNYPLSASGGTDAPKPFNYGQSYHQLLGRLERRLSHQGMQRVCRALASFRPSSIAHLRTLSSADLVLMERSLQRSLVELQRVLPLTGASHCAWRRTGEILHATREFCVLTGWSVPSLTQIVIFDILDERGVVGYWEAYASLVVDVGENHFRLAAGVARPDGHIVPGALWITVKREVFDIPTIIVGCFLPDLWHRTCSA